MSASAVANITLDKRLSWDVIGLDSNKESVGPDTFAVGYRFCNDGSDPATNVVSTFYWDSANANINLAPGTIDTITLPELAAGECYDFYYNVQVARLDTARGTARRYHIGVSADGIAEVSTPIDAANYNEVYVENLVSQNRNSINSITGPSTVFKGGVYEFVLDGSTATNGYEQLETFIDFPNNIFRVLSVDATYSVGGTNDAIYADSCGWVHDPEDPDYFTNATNTACSGTGKAGGDIIIKYQVEIIGTGSATVSALIYDFSGSSFHYNSDYGQDVLAITALDPETLPLIVEKSASRTVLSTTAGETDTFTLTVRNPTAELKDVSVTDTLPTGWAYVPGSATVTWADSSTAAIEPGAPDLTWNIGHMDVNDTVTITFDAITTTDFSGGDVSTNYAIAEGNDFVTGTLYDFDTTEEISFVAVEIEKNSSPLHVPVQPGDTIDYDITVRNTAPAGSGADLYDLNVSDPLPEGTSFVPGSAFVTAYVNTANGNYSDSLAAIAYNGSDGSLDWSTTPWIESESLQDAAADDIRVVNEGGNFAIELNTTGSIERSADLSAYNKAFLTFSYSIFIGNKDATLSVVVTPDGGGSVVVGTYSGSTGGVYVTETVDISSYISANTTLSFQVVRQDSKSSVHLDDVDIQLYNRVLQTNSAGDPGNLILPSDGYDLWAGEELNVSFQVKVDSPLDTSISEINNTASVTTRTLTVPSTASTSDAVQQPATIGDLLWDDANGNGVQDGGESGLAGVTVALYDSTGTTLIDTNLTDGSGNYAFSVPAGTYQVLVVGGGDLTSAYVLVFGTSPATVTVASGDVNNSVDFGYQKQADIAVTKTVDIPAPFVGNDVNFTVTVSNSGPSAASNVVVDDLLPSGYAYIDAAASAGSYNNLTGVWSIASLANSTSATLQIRATVQSSGEYNNTAAGSADEYDPDPSDNNDSAVTAPVPVADVAITKSVDNATPDVGSNVTFTLSASNNGPNTATGVSVSDLLPSGYTYVSDDGGGSYVAGTWSVGTLAPTASATLTITATVKANGDYNNTATISANEADPVSGNNSDSKATTPNPVVDLSITKDVNDTTPLVGSRVTFTLNVANAGPSDENNTVVTDTIPSGYTYVSNNKGASFSAPTLTWNVGDLAAGGSDAIRIVATVNASGDYNNTASVGGTQNDSNSGNNSDSRLATPIPVADLNLTKEVNATMPQVGDEVTFTIRVGNAGPAAVTDANVTEVLPDGYSYVGHTPLAADYNGSVWRVGALAAGELLELNITALVNATGNYENNASVTSEVFDTNLSDNNDSVSTYPNGSADLNVTKVVDNTAPSVGDTVTFTITVGNAGPSDATDVNATDILPDGYINASFTPGAGSYSAVTGLWQIGALNVGSTVSMTVTAEVNASGEYVNHVGVWSELYDGNLTDNNDSAGNTPGAVADLSIIKDVNETAPLVGTDITFTLTATNNGPSDATDVNVTDVLPAGYTFVSASPSTGDYNSTAADQWTIGGLANGDSATLTMVVTVNAAGSYTNTATIEGEENDPDPTNDSNSSTPVPEQLAVIGDWVYDIATSTGLTGVTVELYDATGSTLVDTNVTDGSGNYSFSVPAGEYRVVVVGGGDLTSGYVLISGTNPFDVNVTAGETNNDVDFGYGQTSIDVTKSANPGTVDEPGDVVTFAVVVENNGTTDVNVTSLLDDAYGNLNGQGTCAVPQTLAAGESYSCEFNATVSGNANDIVDSNVTAAATDAGSNVVTEKDNAPVVINDVLPSISVSKDANVSSVTEPGANVNFTIVVTNQSRAEEFNLTSLDDSVYGAIDGNGTCPTLPYAIAADSNLTCTFTAYVSGSGGGSHSNTITASGQDDDGNSANGNDSATVSIDYDLGSIGNLVWDDANGNGILDGGESGLDGTITIELDDGSSTTTINLIAGDNGSYTFADLIAGDYNVTVASVPAGYVLTSGITIGDPVQVTLLPGQDFTGANFGFQKQADLNLTKEVNATMPQVGDEVTFTIRVGNAGPAAVTDANVTEVLPDGYSYVGHTPLAADYNGSVWRVGALAAGELLELNITALVNATGNYENNASVTSEVFDTNLSDNNDSVSTYPNGSADLNVTKVVDNTAPSVGDTVTFTITVGNAGPSDATDVNATDILPSGYSYVSDTAPVPTTYDSASGVWQIGALATGGVIELNITATVEATGVYENNASVVSELPDSNLDDNNDSVSTLPGANPIVANDDTNNSVDGTGGTAIADMNANDTLSGNPFTLGSDVNITSVTNDTPLEVNTTTGEVIVPPGTAGGTYTETYTICEVINPANCATATISVTVTDRQLLLQTQVYCENDMPYVDYNITLLGFDPAGQTAEINWTKEDGSDEIASSISSQPLAADHVLWPGAAVDINGNGTAWPGWLLEKGRWVQIDDGLTPTILFTAQVNPTDSASLMYPPRTPECFAGPRQGAVFGAVFEDIDGNGIQDAGEPGLVGVTINITTVLGDTVSVVTDANGDYNVSGIPAGSTLVDVNETTLPAGYVETTFSDPTVLTVIDAQNNDAGKDGYRRDVRSDIRFDPPRAKKVVNAAGWPELEWRMVWINSRNSSAIKVRVVDPVHPDLTYIGGSVICEPTGGSSTDICDYNQTGNAVVWEGTIAADPGGTNEDDSNNEVVITFRTTVAEGVLEVENQAVGYWDQNGDDSVDTNDSVVTDDPATNPSNDPTRAQSPIAVPTLAEWGRIVLALLLFIAASALLYRRRIA